MQNLIKGSTDFNRVRDGRNAPDAYFDFDLTLARDEFINVAGNSFYVDANPDDGNAVVYFQETDNLRGPTPFYVSPGFIARIPFTQIRIRNTSQPGKKIRVVYGVDTDFQPGSVSQVSFAGEVTVNDVVASVIQSNYGQGVSPVGINVNTLLLPAANINGVNLKTVAMGLTSAPVGGIVGAIVAAPATPANFIGNQINFCLCNAGTGSSQNASENSIARIIPPAWGLYIVHQAVTNPGSFLGSVSYQAL